MAGLMNASERIRASVPVSVQEWPLYHFRGTVRSIRDGDTIVIDIDFGGPRELREKWPIRILGYDAPEVVGVSRAAGLAAEAALEALTPIGSRVYLVTKLDRTNFDRLLAWIYTVDASGNLYSVTDAMIAGGHDVPKATASGWHGLLERSEGMKGRGRS